MGSEAEVDGSVGQGNDGPGKGGNAKLLTNMAHPSKGCRFAVLLRLCGDATITLSGIPNRGVRCRHYLNWNTSECAQIVSNCYPCYRIKAFGSALRP